MAAKSLWGGAGRVVSQNGGEEMKEEGMILVFCMVPDREVGRKLAGILLDEGLVACVSLVGGCESHYVWEGKREVSQEEFLKIKTVSGKWERVRERIREEHPYECPEILRVDVADGLEEYVGWVRRAVGGEG